MSESIIETAVNLTEKERKLAEEKYPGPTEFVHLHNHTLFSTLDGVATPEEYFEACEQLGHPAFTITDHGSMAGVPDAYWEGKKRKITFLPGCEVYYSDYHSELMDRREREDFKIGSLKTDKNSPVVTLDMMISDEQWSNYRRNRHLTVIAMNMVGYHNLISMTTKAWEIGYYYKPRIWFEQLEKYNEGLIVLSGCLNGPICHAVREAAKYSNIASGRLKYDKYNRRIEISSDDARKRKDHYLNEANNYIIKFRDLLGDRFYLELQMPGEEIPFGKEAFAILCKLSKKHGVKPVVSNDCLELDFPILMADGTFKPIGEVEVGDYVITHKSRPRKVVAKKVRNIREGERCFQIKNIPWSMTEGHPLYIDGLCLEDSKAINKPSNAGMYSCNQQIKKVPIEWIEVNQVQQVCDIEVEEDHTFVLWGNIISRNCHLSHRSDFKVQKCMMAVEQGLRIDDPNLFHVDSDEQFYKSRAQLRQTFFEGKYDRFIAPDEFEQALQNTVELANRCEPFSPDLTPKLPEIENSGEKLKQLVVQGLKDKGLLNSTKKYPVDGRMVTHREQALIELRRYIEKGFASYFLIIKDLIDYSKGNGWDIGPGRGSAGGSLVCFILGIHQLDPLKWGLSSVRFMGDSRGGHMLRVSMD